MDLSRVLAGPLVAMTLGDLGADVVKVEAPGGDDTRHWAPPRDSAGRASYHHTANRNKRSIVLDLKQPADLALVQVLCRDADVVVSNFRPGTLERFGLAHGQLGSSAISCEITGFGEGAGRELPGYDPLVQAVGGLMSVTGPPDRPSKVGVAIVDVAAALYATIAVLAALYARRDTGRGQRVTIDLLHANLALLANQSTGFLASGESPVRLGNVHPSIEPFATYRARDGDLMICAGNDRQFRALVTELGLPRLADDPAFSTNAVRVANRDALRPQLERALAEDDTASWAARLAAAGVPAGPINDVPAAFAYASSLGLDVVGNLNGLPCVNYPATLSRAPAPAGRQPPALDEHGAEIRRWLET